jgi:hypothetical protein
MEVIFEGKLSDITHISHFPVLFERRRKKYYFLKASIKLEIVLTER